MSESQWGIWEVGLGLWVATSLGVAGAMHRNRDGARVLRAYPPRVRFLLPGWRTHVGRADQARIATFVRLVYLWRVLLVGLMVAFAGVVVVRLVEIRFLSQEEMPLASAPSVADQ